MGHVFEGNLDLTLVVPWPDQSGLGELHSQTKTGLVWSMAAIASVHSNECHTMWMWVSFQIKQTE